MTAAASRGHRATAAFTFTFTFTVVNSQLELELDYATMSGQLVPPDKANTNTSDCPPCSTECAC